MDAMALKSQLGQNLQDTIGLSFPSNSKDSHSSGMSLSSKLAIPLTSAAAVM